MRPLLALLLLAGCASQVPYSRAPLACQDQAVDLVWRQQYGRADRAPDIWWVPREAQNCGRPMPDGSRGFRDSAGVCVAESAWHDGISAAWLVSWAKSGVAHGFIHVAQARDGLPPDTDHRSPPFQPGGAMDKANAALAAMTCAPSTTK